MARRVNIDNVCYLLLDWNEVGRMIDRLEDKVRKKPYKCNLIIGILRGGAIVASLISDRMGLYNLCTIGAKAYRRTGKIDHSVKIYQPLPINHLKNFDILIVEDVVDTGATYTAILDNQIYPKKPRSLCTVSLHVKPWTKYKPDIFLEETDCWIWYPWELYETGRDLYADLIKKFDSQTVESILTKKFRLNAKTVKKISRQSK